MIITLTYLLLFIIAYALVNGYFIKSSVVYDDQNRKTWHKWGVVVRVLPLAYVLFQSWGKWWDMGLISISYFIMSWIIYDAVISIVIYKNLWQSSATATTDKIKNEWIYKLIVFIVFVAYLIIYLILK